MIYKHNATVLRLPDVIAKTGLSRTTIYNRISLNEFPKPIKLGPRAVGLAKSLRSTTGSMLWEPMRDLGGDQ
jgi:predicted DNA-binding transcriptional regulator AlpA